MIGYVIFALIIIAIAGFCIKEHFYIPMKDDFNGLEGFYESFEDESSDN